ncbi:MAG: hypothetical protein IJ347_07305 [Faecalibacterium sp.]|nr:hypothetical protein [Faecalibacterium sp.]
MKENTRPLPLTAYLITGALMVAALLGFALLVRADVQRSRPVDATVYTEAVPAGLMWQLTEGGNEELITLDGHVLIAGEVIQWWKNHVALYDTQSGEYRQLSTTMVCREELETVANDGINQSYSGIAAMVRTEELTPPFSRYEICVLYETNHHNILVHTGQMLKGGAA